MRRFISSGFQCAVRNIISFSRRQIRSVMAAARSSSETETQGHTDVEQEDTHDTHQDDAEELSNSNSVPVSLSKTSADGSDVSDSESPDEKQELPVSSSLRMSASGPAKHCSLHGMLFAKEQPTRQLHFSLWNSSDKGYRTREHVIRETKGNLNMF